MVKRIRTNNDIQSTAQKTKDWKTLKTIKKRCELLLLLLYLLVTNNYILFSEQTFALFLQSLNFKLGTSTDSEISIEEFNTQTLTIDYIDNVNLTTISSQKYLEMKSWSFLFDN
jgi:hypothetical protein